MPAYPGFDSDVFPGPATLAWLKANTNLVWCGYYLAPAPNHHDRSWMGQRAALTAAGWGLAPTYLGQQLSLSGSHIMTAAQGTIDGDEAAAFMRSEGFAQGSFVYLDLEDGPPFAGSRTDYVAAWVAAVEAAQFGAGVYCSHAFAAEVQATQPNIRVWAYRVPIDTVHPFPGTNFPDSAPAGCGYTGAFMWQLGQNCQITLGVTPPGQLVVDLSTSVSPDPSHP